MRARFITLEGGEGAGKSTQARLLAEALRARGHTVLLTREPGGSPGADTLRALLLGGEVEFSPLAETLLHVAARADHVARSIAPALDREDIVVCDRFADSTMAYQGFGQGADRAVIAAIGSAAVPLVPDLTFVLDVPEATGAARLAARGGGLDRYERLGPAFHARVRAGFRAIAAENPARCVVIDASPPAEDVHAVIVAALRRT